MKSPIEKTEAAPAVAKAVQDTPVIYGFDRFTIWIDRPECPFELSRIENHCFKVEANYQQMPHNPRWKCRVEIFQPTHSCLEILANEFGCATAVVINYVETAFDLPFDSRRRTRERARERRNSFLASAKVLNLRHDVILEKKNQTTFYCGGRRSPSVLALYSDKPSKLNNARPLEDDLRCAHQELRITGEAAVAECGIVSIDDLIRFDHAKFWSENLRFYKIPNNKTQLGRLLAIACGDSVDVTGSALRKRATRWIKKHSIFDDHSDVFVMHNALRATSNIEKLLPQISFTDWLDEVMSI